MSAGVDVERRTAGLQAHVLRLDAGEGDEDTRGPLWPEVFGPELW